MPAQPLGLIQVHLDSLLHQQVSPYTERNLKENVQRAGKNKNEYPHKKQITFLLFYIPPETESPGFLPVRSLVSVSCSYSSEDSGVWSEKVLQVWAVGGFSDPLVGRKG